MCGIVGVASPTAMNHQMKEFFQSLLFHDVVRGHHATGVVGIDTIDRSIEVQKKAVPSPLFLEDKDLMDPLFNIKHNYNIYIGHNRWATSGAKDADVNAHPFVRGDVVGVHNGSLRNQRLLDDAKDFIVDSDNLMYQLNKSGLDDTLAKADGAYALVWYDKRDNTLNFIRNSERPLAIGQLSNGSWVWASEMGMLRWLIARHKSLSWATYKEEEVEYTKLYSLEVGQHMRFEFADKSRSLPVPRLVKKTLPVFPTQSYNGYTGYEHYSGRNYSTTRRDYSAPSEYEKKIQGCIDKFLKGANKNSIVEMKFMGVVEEKTSTGYVGKIATFDYQSANGKRITLNSFCHTNNICKDWGDDKIGTTVFGEFGSIVEHCAASYKCCLNPSIGFTVGVVNLTLNKPNRFFAYCDDATVVANLAAALKEKEGGAKNVIPFREQAAAQTGQKGSEGSQALGAKETTDQMIQRLTQQIEDEEKKEKKNNASGTQTGFNELPVLLANGKMKYEDYIETMTLNAARCSDCSKKLSDMKTTSVYLYSHFDQEEGNTVDYLTCSLKCNRNIHTSCDALDDDYTKQYGASNE